MQPGRETLIYGKEDLPGEDNSNPKCEKGDRLPGTLPRIPNPPARPPGRDIPGSQEKSQLQICAGPRRGIWRSRGPLCWPRGSASSLPKGAVQRRQPGDSGRAGGFPAAAGNVHADTKSTFPFVIASTIIIVSGKRTHFPSKSVKGKQVQNRSWLAFKNKFSL